jgi:hypothetical protein
MRDKLYEASKLRRISTVFKNLCLDLLEHGDTEFDLIYSSSRDSFKGLIFRCDKVGSKTLSFFLKEYGKQVFFKVRKEKRI